jgi:zinc protease
LEAQDMHKEVVGSGPFRRWLVATLAVVTLLSGVLVLQSRRSVRNAGSLFKINEFTLKNGLHVILHEDHRYPKVSVRTVVKVGSSDEGPGQSGYAHLFEHLMFEGEGNSFGYDIQQAGVLEENATTRFDETIYWENGPSNALPTVLRSEANRFANLPHMINSRILENERDVVINELKQNYLGQPGVAANAALFDVLAPGHAYRRSGVGNIADLRAATTESVLNFFTTLYVPQNITMIIAGDIEPMRTKQLLESTMAFVPPGESPPRHRATPQRDCGYCRDRQSFVDDVARPIVRMRFTIPIRARSEVGGAAFEVLSEMFDNDPNGLVFKRLVQQTQVASNVRAVFNDYDLTGTFDIEATAAPNVTAAQLERSLTTAVFKNIKPSDIHRGLVNLVRQHRQTVAFESLESPEGQTWTIFAAKKYGKPKDDVRKYVHRYDAISRDSVIAALRRLRSNSVVFQQVLPGKAGSYPKMLTVSTGQPRSTRTAWQSRPNLHFPDPKDWTRKPVVLPKLSEHTLPNGLKAFYFRNPSAARTKVHVKIAGGLAHDRPEKSGSSTILSELIGRGTTKHDEIEFDALLSLYDANIWGNSSLVAQNVNFSVATRNTESGIELLGEALLQPAIAESAFRLAQTQHIAVQEKQAKSPSAVASRAATQLFPAGDAGRRVVTQATLQSLQRSDIATLHAERFQPQSTELIAVGAMSAADFFASLDHVFGDWKNIGAPASKFSKRIPEKADLRILLVDRPDAPQTTILLASTAAESGPNVDVELARSFLGGRLQGTLREKEGTTYGVSALSDYDGTANAVYLSASVDTKWAGAAARSFAESFVALGSNTQTSVEFVHHSRYNHALEMAANGFTLVREFRTVRDQGRDWAEFAKSLNSNEPATPEALDELLQTSITDIRRVLVLVGDIRQFRTSLELQWPGQITQVDPEF